MKTMTWQYRQCVAAGGLVLLTLLVGAGSAAQTTIQGRITYEVQDGVYVNVGTDSGLAPGLVGTVQFKDGRTAQFEVVHAAKQSALLRLVAFDRTELLLNRSVELLFEPRHTEPAADNPTAEAPSKQGSPTPDSSRETTEPKEFVPLLAPAPKTPEVPSSRNVTHGRVELRQLWQTDSQDDLGYSVSRIRSSGAMERIEGSPWSFAWSGDLRYRSGDAYQDHPDYEEVRPSFYTLMFQRPVGDGGFVRFGRFVPVELPGVGYVDGFQGETRRGEGLRLGVIAGLKPDRVDLDASADEPSVTGYASIEAGHRGQSYYSGTIGLLNSYYEGEIDRLAILLDQRADLGPRFSLYSTTEVDLDSGAAEVRDGTRLTRLDVFAEYRLSSVLGLRAGADHWERPDNQAERDLLAFEDERFFDDGYWRYWVGSYQKLPWSLRLYEELAFIDSDTSEDNTRWQVRLTRTGLFDMRNASASVAVYGLTGDDTDGYGLRASGYLPFGEWLAVQPAAGFRTLQMGSASEDITLTYLSLYLDGHLSRTWSLFGGLDYHTGDGVDATLLEIGLRYLW